MKLFSEKVAPTFTNSPHNILTVKDYNEIFFDVYEFEINGNSYIAEKTSSYRGAPIVNIPIVKDNKKTLYPFILNKGDNFEVLFNPESKSNELAVVEEDTTPDAIETLTLERFASDVTREFTSDVIQDIVFEEKRNIIEDIERAKKGAREYIKSLTWKQHKDVVGLQKQQQQVLQEKVESVKMSFLDDFITLTSKIKSELVDYNENNRVNIEKFIERYLNKRGSKLARINEKNYTKAIASLESYIDDIANSLLHERISTYTNTLEASVAEIRSEVIANEKSIEQVDTQLHVLEQATVELNDKFTKQSNRALSRIGSLRDDLNKTIDESVKKISNYYTDKIFQVETKIGDIDNNLKQTIVNLIKESRESLISEIANIQHDIPNIVIEKKAGKQEEINLKGIKTELEKSISSKFSSEIMTLKKMIELSHGSGSVAVQYANGGVMNGSLIITGSLSAKDYLGIASSLSGDFLPITGGTVTGPVTITSYLSTNSIKFNTTSSQSISVGEIAWDIDTESLTYGTSQSNKIHIGLEDFYRVKANGVVIPAGSVVWATSAISQGNSGIILANNIAADSQASPKYLLGVSPKSIDSTNIGLITNFGVVREVNLNELASPSEHWKVGDVLYPSPTIPGGWTNVEPQPPNLRIALAFILFINNGTQKTNVTIMVRASEHGFRLEELHNVYDNGYTHNDGALLAYNSNLSGWFASTTNNVKVGSLSAVDSISAPNITTIEDKINSIYAFVIQNFDRNITGTSSSISQFIASEWSPSLNLQPGDTVTLSAANTVYVLSNSDGSGVNNYFEVNLRPNFLFYRTNIQDYDIIDSFPLSAMKSSKYVVEVEDKQTSDIFFAELNVIGSTNIAVVTEYGSNYTTQLPFIEFGAVVINDRISLSAVALEGYDITKFIIKGNRSVFF